MAAPVVRVEVGAFLVAQSAFDTRTDFAGGDAIGYVNLSIVPVKEFLDSQEQQGTASHIGFVEDKQSCTWSLEAELKHTDGGTPELDALLQHIWGTASGTGPRTYTLNNNAPTSLQLGKTDSDAHYVQGSGLVCTEWEVSNEGGSIAMLRASGVGAGYDELAGDPTLGAILTATSTSATVTAAERQNIRFDRGFYVAFGSDTNSGSGYLITNYVPSTGVITFTPGAVTGAAASDRITPIVPTASYSGTRIGGISSNITLNSVSNGFTSAKVKGTTGFQLLDLEASTDRPNRAERGPRRISSELSFYLLNENAQNTNLSFAGTQVAQVVRVGASAGPNFTLTCPAARIAVHEKNASEDAPLVYTVETFATRSAADNDELGVTAS